VPQVVKSQAVELSATHSRPEDPSHEVVPPPYRRPRGREHQVKGTALPGSELLGDQLCRDDGQIDYPLSTRLRLAGRSRTSSRLYSNGSIRKIDSRTSRGEDFSLA
jgi:hypothetical protein